ncbi:hypothetical protein BVX97_00895 [bacterium E08(2017)]|nr:hypothetical protein BVX97_00895 [bacterium E08(2017)]
MLPLLAVFVISFSVMPVNGVAVANNSAKWLDKGAKVYHGKPAGTLRRDMDVVRGPVYPAIIAMSFNIAGQTVQAASLATRLFFALGLVALYVLGRRLRGVAGGLLAFSLALSSRGINEVATTLDTDIVQAFFLLVFFILCYESYSRKSVLYPLAAGMVLGLAFLVKESAILFAGVPALYSLLARREVIMMRVRRSGWMALSCGAVMLCWILYVYFTYGSVGAALGGANPEFQKFVSDKVGASGPLQFWLRLFTIDLLSSLSAFYVNVLMKISPYPWLLVFAAVWTIVGAIRGRKDHDIFISTVSLVLVPAILWSGKLDIRLGQTIFVYPVLYLMLAGMVIDFSEMLRRRLPRQIPVGALTGVIGAVLVVFQMILVPSTWKLWTSGKYRLSISRPGADFEVYGRFTDEQRRAAEWFREEIGEGKVMADGYSHEAMDFWGLTDENIPVFHPVDNVKFHEDIGKVNVLADNPVFFMTYSKLAGGADRHRSYYVIYEQQILDALKVVAPEYLIMSGKGRFYSIYFDAVSWASSVYSDKNIFIYKLEQGEKTCEVRGLLAVNDTLPEHKEWLAEHHPKEHEVLVQVMKRINVTDEDIENSLHKMKYGYHY